MHNTSCMNKINKLIITAVLGVLCACQGGSFSNDKETTDSTAVDSSLHIAIIMTAEADSLMGMDCARWIDSLGIDVTVDTFYSAMDADTAFLKGHAHMLMTDSVKVEYLKKVMKEMSAQGADAQNDKKAKQGKEKTAQGKGAAAKGADAHDGGKDSIIVLHNSTLTLSLITTKSSRIKNIKSLKDKIIAVTRNSAIDYTADQVMMSAQLKNEELNRPQINDISLRANMLILDQYDGAILPEPYATQCEKRGAYRLYQSESMMLAVVAKQRFARSHRKEIETIIKAYKDAKVEWLKIKAERLRIEKEEEEKQRLIDEQVMARVQPRFMTVRCVPNY